MMRTRVLFEVFTIFFIILLQETLAAKEFTVGVSPPLIELGEISPESSKPISFYIVTSSDEPLVVYLESLEPLTDFFEKPSHMSYLDYYSEESTSSWAQFFSNPVELRPEGETTFGSAVKGWREINFLLNVPKNAEPGYHLFRVSPRPVAAAGGGGQMGVQIATITPINIFFKIPGDAVRQGKILDITTGKQIGNSLELFTHFINTGTVTISARANKIEVYDKNGKLKANLTSNIKTIKPKEKQIFSALLPLNDLRDESYIVSSNVNFISSNVQKNATIRINPETVVVTAEVTEKPFEFPLWIIILIVLLIIVIIYRRIHEND